MKNPNEVIMYIIVNSDLPMSKGKIAAQVGHVVEEICYSFGQRSMTSGLYKDEEYYAKWREHSRTKIVLQAPQSYLEELIALGLPEIYCIRDEGRTEIEAGSLTCIGFIPMPEYEAQKYVKGLKLI